MTKGLVRILTAIVGIPVVLGCIWAGGWWFFGLIAAICLGGTFEFTQLSRSSVWPASPVWALILSSLLLLRFTFDWAMDALLVGVLVFLVSLLKTGVDRRPVVRMASTLAPLIYPVGLLSLLLPIRTAADAAYGVQGGFEFTLLLFVLIWTADTFAYYTGSSIGRLKLAPVISPNKTWEGAAGGLVGALVVAWLYAEFRNPAFGVSNALALGAIAGVLGPVGDLIESVLKRSAGVKDTSNLLPGHGGLLDRFDALIFTVPIYYVYLTYFTDLL